MKMGGKSRMAMPIETEARPILTLFRRVRKAMCPGGAHISGWFGLRGLITMALVLLLARFVAAEELQSTMQSKSVFQRRGFYLHACWVYNYPFAVRTWHRSDYLNMFRLLKHIGFNTVMMWPTMEAIPAPLSAQDRQSLAQYRSLVEDARKTNLQCWLVQCAALTSRPEIRSCPWKDRSLYAYQETVRLDDPKMLDAYLEHRAAMLEILNNADGYVTIDGDPGGYPGAQPAEFLEVLKHDRHTLDRIGTHAQEQRVIPWIWCGWGTKGVWQEPISPFVAETLKALKQEMPEPWEMLPGRSHRDGHANGRIVIDETKRAGLLDRSTLMLYEIVEFEPSPPAGLLQFDLIRRVLKQELGASPGIRGWFANAQTPILAIPNAYLFARGVSDPNYLDEADEKVLTDLADLLGGSAELLVPAWACWDRGLADLPGDLPRKLAAATLDSPVARCIPGGPKRYLDILAARADSRIRLLNACARKAESPEDAAQVIASATAALVDWWKHNGYVSSAKKGEPFQLGFVHHSQLTLLMQWCVQNVTDYEKTSALAVDEIVRGQTLDRPLAIECVRQLLKR